MDNYNFKEVEKRWADFWVKEKVFTPNLEKAKDPYYALFMFPYPSAEGLHIGNFYAFTCVDVMAKFKKLQGKDVFEPFGFDAFGMHLENYALSINEKPRDVERRTTDNFRKQVQAAGLSCDYTREVDTTTPEYYKWTQWIFTKLFEQGLAYQKEALLNWCPSCKTVLADEQIEGGVCERCKTIPEKKHMKQWFFKITEFAQRMLDGLEEMDWSDITKAAQKNWIGRSEGARVKFEIIVGGGRPRPLHSEDVKPEKREGAGAPSPTNLYNIEIFTTRPDTLFGATYFVMAPEHELVDKITAPEQREAVLKYIKEAGAKSDLERTESKEKTGVFTGAYAINPINNEKIPVWIADYVLMGYGTGAIMAVPAHDERDFEFAKKYEIEIRAVVMSADQEIYRGLNMTKIPPKGNKDYDFIIYIISQSLIEWPTTQDGVAINSGFLDGLSTADAKKKMIKWLEEKKLGKGEINYRLRDWCISRQRYWGPPVPVVYCSACGAVAVPEKDLPVLLPELEEGWEPAGDGRGPLAKVDSFMNTTCPVCGGEATREADVMDNFLDSAWYFFRYISPGMNNKIFDTELGKKWLPVDLYVGGNEHAVLHLMYTRFITMALNDIGVIDFDNPFKRFRANGMILKDGKKMSKSKGNVVSPEEYGEKVGYDALKAYILFLGPLSEDRSFSDAGVGGTKRWVERIARLEEKVQEGSMHDAIKQAGSGHSPEPTIVDSGDVLRKFHQTIKAVGDDFEEQKYNTAIARLMEMTNVFAGAKEITTATWKKFIVLIAPFLPALAEEMWNRARVAVNDAVMQEGSTASANAADYGASSFNSIFASGNVWPEYDAALAREDKIELVVQINGKVRDKIEVDANITEEEAKKLALESENIKKWTEGKEVVKIIYVKGGLVNIVVK